MYVEIHQLVGDGKDKLAGVLRLDGSAISAEPADSRLLAGILAEPIWDPRANAGYDAEHSPEEWLLALHREYTSAYLRASKPIEDGKRVEKSWDEVKHPRGQPENKGEFAPKGGGDSRHKESRSGHDAEGLDIMTAERDWKENGTRSKAFKAWFGDWENGSENASKVINSDGEPQETYHLSKAMKDGKPMVLYHGTSKGGFEEFSKDKIAEGNLYGPGFYFTEDKGVAEEYTKKDERETQFDVNPPIDASVAKALNEKIKAEKESVKQRKDTAGWVDLDQASLALTQEDFYKDDGTIDITKVSQNLDPRAFRALKDVLRDAGHEIKEINPNASELKECYLNIRKPLDMDAKASDEFIEGIRQVIKNKISATNTWHLAEGGVGRSQLSSNIDSLERNLLPDYETGKHRSKHGSVEGVYRTMQDAVGEKIATHIFQLAGFDGITHIGGDRVGGGHHHRVWIAFEPNQIKSVSNRGTFDPKDANINKSLAPAVTKAHEEAADASALAQHYAESWNLLGGDVPDEELHAASEELSGTPWRVTRRPDGEWRAHHHADKKPLREWRRKTKSWEESKHPRGQAENKGEFAPKGQRQQQPAQPAKQEVSAFQDYLRDVSTKIGDSETDQAKLVEEVYEQADKAKESLAGRIDDLISHVTTTQREGWDEDMRQRAAPCFEEYEKAVRENQKELEGTIDAVRDAFDDLSYGLTHHQGDEDHLDELWGRFEDAQKEYEDGRAQATQNSRDALSDLFSQIDSAVRERNEAWERDADDEADSLNDDYEDDPEGAASDAKIVNEEFKKAGNPYRVLQDENGEWYSGFPEEDEEEPHKPVQGELFKSQAWSYIRKAFGPAIKKEAQRAPKGGVFLVNLQGEAKMYLGGQWIPATDIANLAPGERAKLEAAKQAAKTGRINRGNINPEELRGQLQPHARELSEPEQKRAGSEFQALHNYHGELTLHRIEQLTKQQQEFLKRPNLTDKQKAQIQGNLARLHKMLDFAEKRGITGAVPKEMQQEALAKTAKQEPPKAAPVAQALKEAKPDSTGFLSGQSLINDPRFYGKDREFDSTKAVRALKNAIGRWQEMGNKTIIRLRGYHPTEVVLDGQTLRTAEGKPVGLLSVLHDEKSGLQFVKGEKKQEEIPEALPAEKEEIPEALPAGKSAAQTESPMSAEDKGAKKQSEPKQEEKPAEQFLDADAYAKQAEFTDANGRTDLPKAAASMAERARKHIEQGGRVLYHLEGEKSFVVSDISNGMYKDAKGNRWGFAPLMMTPGSGIKFLPPEKPAARTESPMSAEDAAKALAKQAGHVAQPKEGSDAASNLNRRLMEEGKEQPAAKPQSRWPGTHSNVATEAKPASPKLTPEQEDRLRRNKEAASQALQAWQNRSAAQSPKVEEPKAEPKATPAKERKKKPQEDNGKTELEKAAERLANETPEEKTAREAIHHPDETPEEKKSREEREQKIREQYALNYGPGGEHGKKRAEAHQREVWAGKARKEGIDPKHLHAAADEIMKEQDEHRERRRRILKDAKEMLAQHGYNAGMLTANLRSGRVEDRIPAFDVVSHAIANRYPGDFHRENVDESTRYGESSGGENDAADQLQQMLADGVPPPVDTEKAYEEALEFLRHQKEQNEPRQEREPGQEEEEESNEPWLEDENDFDFGANQWKSLRAWLRKSRKPELERVWSASVAKARRAKPHGPTLPGMFDESQHPRQAAGSGHGGQFTSKHVQDALARYANRDTTAQGGGLFGGEDLQARRGFAKLPHGTPIVFTHGEFEGQTGHIVRDEDSYTGAPRIVAEVEGRPGLVPITPDAIEPIQRQHSWRMEGGGVGAEHQQGALFSAEHYLPKR